MAQQFKPDLIKAEWIEQALARYLNNKGWHTIKKDYRLFNYDLDCTTPVGLRTLEVKALDWLMKGYDQFVLEIFQDDNKTRYPAWIKHIDDINNIVFIKMSTGEAFFFDAATLHNKFMDLLKQGRQPRQAHAGKSNRNDCPGWVYFVPQESKDYGFINKVSIIDHIYDTIPQHKQVLQFKDANKVAHAYKAKLGRPPAP